MPTSDKEIEKLQNKAEKLRAEISRVRAEREAAEREAVNDITASQLENEITTLERDLASEKDRAKPASLKQGLAAPLGNAQAAMEAAAAAEQPKPAEKPAATAGKEK